MKTLAFNGSPKRDKSDTLHITRAFLEGMKEVSEQEITTIHVIDKHIEYCMGCFECKRNGGTCIHDDDMKAVLEQISNSEHNFEPAVAQFKLCFPNNHTIITVPESPMFNAPEADVVTKPRLELVKKAGRQYAESGTIDAELLAEIGSPMIPEDVYARIANSEA